MEKNMHTPGPWKNEGWEDSVVNDCNGNTLAAMPGANYGRSVMKANARLIAAAPELLEALNYALDRIKDFDPKGDEFISAAIAKATKP